MNGISIVTAALNEEAAIANLLRALAAQSRLPDEVLIADGGSTDGTLDVINALAKTLPFRVRVLEVPGKIAAGRNAAIEAADGEIIAVTDADCVPAGNWLHDLTTPILEGRARAAAGGYQADARTALERAIATFTWVPLSDESTRFLPSHRSVAYERDLWREIGGYDTEIDSGEDTLFDVQVEKACGFAYVPSATVLWKPRSSVRKALRQQIFYGGGDGQARIQVPYHATIAAFIALEAGIFAPLPALRYAGILAYAAGLTYFARKHYKLFGRLFPDLLSIAELLVLLPAARLAGFCIGLCGGSVRAMLLRS